MEIERKFLIPVAPMDLEEHPSNVIDQGYLALTPEGVEVRVRRKGERYYLTVKHGKKLSRTEVEVPISPAQFDELWPLTAGRRLRKTRYDLPGPGGLVIELDVYTDALAGLQTADVEFANEAAAHAFQPPEFFGREISGDSMYRNERLAREGLPQEDSRSKVEEDPRLKNQDSRKI